MAKLVDCPSCGASCRPVAPAARTVTAAIRAWRRFVLAGVGAARPRLAAAIPTADRALRRIAGIDAACPTWRPRRSESPGRQTWAIGVTERSSELVQLRVARTAERGSAPHPRYVVWELTLACDQRCAHCGSRAAEARPDELDDGRGARASCGSWRRSARARSRSSAARPTCIPASDAGRAAHRAAGMRADDDDRRPRRHRRARRGSWPRPGMHSVAVSVDGLARHARSRARDARQLRRGARGDRRTCAPPGSLVALQHRRQPPQRRRARAALRDARRRRHARLAGAAAWRRSAAPPIVRSCSCSRGSCSTLVPRIARLKERAFADGILLTPGNNVGYFSRDEKLLRSLEPDGNDHWSGCQAGRFVMGIESDGAVKGCPSLPTRGYVGGNVRDAVAATDLGATRPSSPSRAAAPSTICGASAAPAPFADVCLGGCTFTAHALFGRPGNNPYCHFRAKTLAADGVRERLVVARARAGRAVRPRPLRDRARAVRRARAGGARAGATSARLARLSQL